MKDHVLKVLAHHFRMGEFHMYSISEQQSFIVSQQLGDGHLDKSGKLIEIAHGEEWLPYLEWKKSIATTIGLRTSDIVKNLEITNLGTQTKCRLYIHCRDLITKSDNVVDLVNQLTPLSLLLWWLDDGCLSIHEKTNGTSISRFGYLCTENFSHNDNKLLSFALSSRFGISTNIHVDRGSVSDKDKIYYRLYLNATAMRRLIDIVRPFIGFVPECMRYKLNMDYRPNRLKSSLGYSEQYNF